MCYIIFIKCKINQHINTRDTVCFYRTFTMGVTCGIFFYRVNNTKTDWRQFDMGFFTHRNPTFCFMKCKLGEKFHFFILSKPDVQVFLAILSLRNRSHIHPYTHTQIFKQWSSCRLTRQEKNSGQLNTLQCAPSKLGCLWTYATERSKQALLLMQQKGE